jgi:DNA-binding response OmpR family regulator
MNGNTNLLLLAEDEPLILLYLQDALEAGGYDVIPAQSGHEASAILEERYTDFAGFVTDIKLGKGPDGWQLAHRARELSPSISIIYATGDSAVDWAVKGVPQSVVLQKPFAEKQLLTALSMLLSSYDKTDPPTA